MFQNDLSNLLVATVGEFEIPNSCNSDATSRNKSARRVSNESPANNAVDVASSFFEPSSSDVDHGGSRFGDPATSQIL